MSNVIDLGKLRQLSKPNKGGNPASRAICSAWVSGALPYFEYRIVPEGCVVVTQAPEKLEILGPEYERYPRDHLLNSPVLTEEAAAFLKALKGLHGVLEAQFSPGLIDQELAVEAERFEVDPEVDPIE